LAATIDNLVPNYFSKAVLVANMVDAGGGVGGDTRATRELHELVQKKQYVSVLDDDFAPDELVAIYGQARLVLGTRLHSVIMALAAGTPAVAVSYVGHKTEGVMQAVGLGQYLIPFNTFTRESALPLVLSAAAMRGAVADRIENLRREGDEVFNTSIRAIASRARAHEFLAVNR
jgi:polysaccharide pyruvyl transferase WcaK-like protein